MFFDLKDILSATQIVGVYLWVLPLGLIVGIIVGAIPGFSASNTLMMLLPMTLAMDIYPALIFMSAVYCGGNMGDSVPAVLINTPGAGGSVATCFDGYPMAKKGLAQQALIVAIIASAIGGLVGSIIALFLMPALGKVALKFKNAEMFVVVLFGLTLIAQLSSKNLAKGLLAGSVGLLIGAIGFDHMWSIPRATFGVLELYEGTPRIAAMVGLFAISESLIMVDRQTIAGERQQVGQGTLQDAQAVLGETQIGDDPRVEQADRVAGDRIAEARVELLGHRRAADDMAALQHGNRQTGPRQIAGACQAIVTAADDDGVAAALSVHDALAPPGCAL